MTDRFAVDTNAVIDLTRTERVAPPPLLGRADVFLPLPVAGELLAGAYGSHHFEKNVAATEVVIAKWTILLPNLETADHYGRIRARSRLLHQLGQARTNDLWIAALCLQHALPLLTNDRGFDGIDGLTVIHW